MAAKRTPSAGSAAWKRPTTRPFAVTAIALAIIWLIAPRSPYAAWLVGAFAAGLLLPRENIRNPGFCWSAGHQPSRLPSAEKTAHAPVGQTIDLQSSARLRSRRFFTGAFRDALQAWWPAYLAGMMVFTASIRWRTVSRASILGALAYLAGCVLQQLVYQHLICRATKTPWLPALLFSLVHAPNPVLMPLTFFWGAIAWALFRRHRSLWAVAIFQYLLSGIAYALIPYAWHHGFRIGPRYFAR